jgi:hypothetical protein
MYCPTAACAPPPPHMASLERRVWARGQALLCPVRHACHRMECRQHVLQQPFARCAPADVENGVSWSGRAAGAMCQHARFKFVIQSAVMSPRAVPRLPVFRQPVMPVTTGTQTDLMSYAVNQLTSGTHAWLGSRNNGPSKFLNWAWIDGRGMTPSLNLHPSCHDHPSQAPRLPPCTTPFPAPCSAGTDSTFLNCGSLGCNAWNTDQPSGGGFPTGMSLTTVGAAFGDYLLSGAAVYPSLCEYEFVCAAGHYCPPRPEVRRVVSRRWHGVLPSSSTWQA